ncbi:MAG: hypothetical protein ACREDT_01875 [Methylocella sp.]|jgi:hypothetical protein
MPIALRSDLNAAGLRAAARESHSQEIPLSQVADYVQEHFRP